MNPNQEVAGRFEPIHGGHAIDQVLFVIQMLGAIDENLLRVVLDVADQFKTELQGGSDIGSPIPFPFGNAFHIGPMPVAQNFGRIMQNFRRDGSIESDLRIERGSITFRTTKYDGWTATWARASKYITALIPHYFKQVPLAGITLTYVDKFVWIGDPNECRPQLLLRPSSQYLAPRVYDSSDLWHNHSGLFVRLNTAVKRLLNVNVDYVDEATPQAPRRTLGIFTVVNDLFNQPTYEPTNSGNTDLSSLCLRQMEELHQVSKSAVANIISDEMCTRIGLVSTI